ncbi:MAG TPA: sigma-70 family RNA polymerase sigma factor [Thermoanaerobaculia bacterium]|nr:sigma-70 family RNA polymerase sigma factor [Thermoanaerobaculia bacterium]
MTSARTMAERDPEWSADVTAVVDRVRPQLRKTLKSYRVPVPDSEDLVQDALLALVTRWEHIREPGFWLIGAVRHLCRDYVRRQLRSKLVGVDREQLEWLAGGAPSGEEQHGARRDLERLVRELTPQQRRLLRLSFGLGLDLRELGRLLGGAKPESIRRARWRAITRLRELMAAER